MFKYRFSYVIDITITSAIFFVLFFCWIRFYTKNAALSAILGILITALVVFLLFFYRKKKSAKKEISAKKRSIATNCATQLKFSPFNKVKKFFFDIFKEKNQVEQKKEGLIIIDNNKKTFFAPIFLNDVFSVDDFAKLYVFAKKYNAKNLTVCAFSFDDNTKNLAKTIKNLNITLLDAFDTYTQIIEPSNKIPDTVIDTQKTKLTFREIISYALSKDRTKNYLLLGFVLIFSSFFVMFRVYYLVSGSILLVLAIITRILPYKKKHSAININL